MLPIWILIIGAIYVAYSYNFDARLIGAAIVLVGLVTNAFAWLVGLIALIPFIGSPTAKILSLPFVWLLNALGYIVSFVAIRLGYTEQVLTHRVLTMVLIIGIIVGFVIGQLV